MLSGLVLSGLVLWVFLSCDECLSMQWYSITPTRAPPTTSTIVPILATAIATIAPMLRAIFVLRIVGAVSVLNVVGALPVLKIVGAMYLLTVVGTTSV